MRTFELESASGVSATFCDRGAALTRLRAPDRDGRVGDVLLGFDDPTEHSRRGAYFGVVVGRFANRIANARFALDGREVRLDANEPPHHLHGGTSGLSTQRFEAEPFCDADCEGLRFHHRSPDGAGGYPGCLDLRVEVRLDSSGTLRFDLRAEVDRPTVLNLTVHPYFNLRDGGASTVLDHELAIAASHYVPVDPVGIPLGELRSVEGTAFDFREPARVGARIGEVPDARGGYDHAYLLDGLPGCLRRAARLRDPASGRTLELETTQPGLQLYTGNHLALRGRGGVRYARHHGICLEAQGLPDAPNQPGFPSARLDPGETWQQAIVHRFGVDP